MEMGGFQRKGGDYKVLGKMSAVVLFLFSFYFGESFCGTDNIESANGVITPNSFALTEIQVSFFFSLSC